MDINDPNCQLPHNQANNQAERQARNFNKMIQMSGLHPGPDMGFPMNAAYKSQPQQQQLQAQNKVKEQGPQGQGKGPGYEIDSYMQRHGPMMDYNDSRIRKQAPVPGFTHTQGRPQPVMQNHMRKNQNELMYPQGPTGQQQVSGGPNHNNQPHAYQSQYNNLEGNPSLMQNQQPMKYNDYPVYMKQPTPNGMIPNGQPRHVLHQQPHVAPPGQHQPGQHQPGQHQPGQHQPGQHQPGQHQPGQHQSGQHQSGQHQPGQHQPGQHQSGIPGGGGGPGPGSGPGAGVGAGHFDPRARQRYAGQIYYPHPEDDPRSKLQQHQQGQQQQAKQQQIPSHVPQQINQQPLTDLNSGIDSSYMKQKSINVTTSPPGMASPKTLPDRSDPKVFLHAARRLTAKENPLPNLANYCYVYEDYRNWAESQLVYHTELREVCYVVFIELWCRLLTHNVEEAYTFLEQYAVDHFINHHEELMELKSIRHINAVRNSTFATRVIRGEKFSVVLGLVSRKLLTTRLTYERNIILLNVIQARAIIECPGDTDDSIVIAQMQTDMVKPKNSKQDSGMLITPSLQLLSGLLQPDFGISIESIDRPFVPEPTSSLFPENFLNLYPLPLAHADSPSIKWRLISMAERRYHRFLSRKDVSATSLPSVLGISVRLRDVVSESIRGISKNDSLRLAGCYLNSTGDYVAMCDQTSRSIWINNVRGNVWNRVGKSYADVVDNIWTKPDDIMNDVDGDIQTVKIENNIIPSRICLTGHSKRPTGFSFLSRFLSGGKFSCGISSSLDGTMNLWSLDSSAPIHTWNSGSPIYGIDADQFGYQFLTAHHDRVALLWSMDHNAPTRVFSRHAGVVNHVKFHPNSILVSTCCSMERRARLWDPRVADIIGSVSISEGFEKVEFSPSGRLLAAYGTTNQVYIWDILEGTVFKILKLSARARDVSFSNNSRLIAVALETNILEFWDVDRNSVPGPVEGITPSTTVLSDTPYINSNINYLEQQRREIGNVSAMALSQDLMNVKFTEKNTLVALMFDVQSDN